MDKALRHIAKLKNDLVPEEDLLRAAWKVAVGPRLEAHARFRELVRDRAVIEVDDKIWQTQLTTLRGHILEKLAKVVGQRTVKQLEFRVAIPRKAPQSAGAEEFQLLPQDVEARRIEDPLLRRIYLDSKRRAVRQ